MAATPPAIEVSQASKWYGQVLGVSHINMSLNGGIVGLLGPNGAGKSTLIKLLSGLIRPSRGVVRVLGNNPADWQATRKMLGYCPEHEGTYDELSALEFVTTMARLSGVPKSQAQAKAIGAITAMNLEGAMHRRLGGFSKGMRQRIKLAQAMVHDPQVMLFDEPLTGCDPLARRRVVEQIRALGEAGKSIIVSSHVLHEVQAITDEIILIYRGQVLAEGNIFAIRELIDKHPHRVRVTCDQPRELARELVMKQPVVRVQFPTDDNSANVVEIETHEPAELYDTVPRVALDAGIKITELYSPDNNLEAVFSYLTEQWAAAKR